MLTIEHMAMFVVKSIVIQINVQDNGAGYLCCFGTSQTHGVAAGSV